MVDPGQVFEHPTVAGLAAVSTWQVGTPVRPDPRPITVAGSEIEDEYPLSPMQKG